MAKDPNSSNNPNGANEIGSSLSERIADIGRSAYTIPAEERELRRKAKVAREGMSIYESMDEIQRRYPPIQKLNAANVNTISRTEPRIRVGTEARLDRYTQQAVNEVGRAFSETSVNGQIRDIAGTQAGQLASAAYINSPYSNLQTRSSAIQEDINQLKSRAMNAAEGIFSKRGINPGAHGELREVDKQLQSKLQELAPINTAMRIQRQQGTDPESTMSSLAVRSHEAQSMKGPEAKALVDAFQELTEAAKSGAKNLDDLQKNALEAAENLEKAQKAGGGGGNFTSYANIAQSGFGAGAMAAQQIGVNQRLGQTQNAAGYADFENQKYQTYKAAAGGNIAAMMQLSQFAGGEDFGSGLKTAANVAVGLQVAGGATQLAAGAVDIASTFNPAENAVSTSAAQANREKGIINSIQGAATVAVGTTDLARGVSGGQADLAGRNARMEVSRAINAVGAEQVQGFRDFSVGMGSAAIGMGGAGEDFLKRSISDSNLSRMANSRISPEQMTQMAQMGQANMGSTFNENQIFAARGAEARGYGTMQENMQRMSSLAAAGTNNPQASLAGVMEVALTKGLDSSKALNAVVDHTAQMAASSTGRAFGMDTSAAAAAVLTAGIGRDTPNKEAALERSASIQEKLASIGTNTNVSYAGMVNTARIGRSTGLGGIDAILAARIDDPTLMSLGKGGKDASTQLQAMGIDTRGKNAGTIVSQLKEDRQMQLLEAGNFGVSYNRSDALKRMKSGQNLTPDEEIGLNRSAGLQGITGQELKSRVMSITAAIDPNAPTGTKAMTMPGADDKSLRTSLDKMRTMGFEQLSTAAQTAATNMGGASKAISSLTTAFENLEKAMPQIEKSATTAAGRAAGGDKGLDVNGFNVAVTNLNTVLNNALKKSGLSPVTDNKQKTQAPGP